MAAAALQLVEDIAPPSSTMNSDALPRQGYYDNSMHIDVPTRPEEKYSTDQAAAMVSQYESGNKNIPNYRYDKDHTAGGYFQITNTNWNKYAPVVGIDLSTFPDALSAPYDAQKTVFDRMYADHGFGPWAPYNPRLAEALGSFKFATPGWVPSPQAFDTEDRKSNTNVRYMSPEEYLSLLPPLEKDESTKAKGENLKKSLSSGDNIEALPSLEVEPKGDNLRIVDHDGRNRAQAAIDAGVDRIPVAINGAPEGKEYKNLIGRDKKTLPYSEFKPVPSSSAISQAQNLAPGAFQQGGPGVQQEQSRSQALAQPQAPQGPQPSIFDQAQAQATAQSPVPTKPDYYPQIAAGINSDIINPRNIGYRGTGVPDEATNATAGNRIAATNARSAGQVGLTPSSPASSLLSSLNPIGSAQAGEAPLPAALQASDIPPPTSGGSPLQVSDIPPPGQKPYSSFPDLADVVSPISNAIQAPIANALTSGVANFLGAGYGGGAELGRMMRGQRPSMGDYQQARQNALNKLTIPETPVGQAISSIISSPARLVGWAAEQILGPELSSKVAPWAQIATDVAGPLAMASGPVLNTLAKPISPVLSKIAGRTPETRAAMDVNKIFPAELKRGGRSAQEISDAMAFAKAKGIPLTLADLSKPNGPLESMLSRSLENTPEGVASAEKFLKERIEGVPSSSSGSTPVGGTRDRMIREAEKHFGSGSYVDVSDALAKSLSTNQKNLASKQAALNKVNENLNTQSVLGNPPSSLIQQQARAQKTVNDLASKIAKESLDQRSLNYGKNLLRDTESNRVERINQFLSKLRGTGTPDAFDNFKLGLGDAVKHEYDKIRQEGKEPTRVNLPPDIKNKISAAFGYDRRAADDFFDTVEMEDLIKTRGTDFLKDIKREGYISEANKRKMRFIMESASHLIGHLIWAGRGVFSPLYWAIKLRRQISDFLSTGGGSAAKHAEIAKALLDPNISVNTTGNLLNVPSRNALSQQRINTASNALARGGIMSATTANQQPLTSP